MQKGVHALPTGRDVLSAAAQLGAARPLGHKLSSGWVGTSGCCATARTPAASAPPADAGASNCSSCHDMYSTVCCRCRVPLLSGGAASQPALMPTARRQLACDLVRACRLSGGRYLTGPRPSDRN